MKKILTIFATAGFLSVLAGAAQAAQISMIGSVGQACNIVTTTDGTLVADNSPTTSLSTAVPATVTVFCNTTGSTLEIVQDANSIPSQVKAPTVNIKYATGGTGIYSGLNGGTITNAANGVTSATGDVAKINSTVKAFPNKLLAPGVYKVNIIATLTP